MASVMIVDDARIMRMNLRSVLEKLGHVIVAEAENGDEALNLYSIHQPDFVTMDIQMPSVNNSGDGIITVQSIKKIDSNAKIIMVSSHGEQSKIIRAIEHGAANYILKPINEKKLDAVIKKIGF